VNTLVIAVKYDAEHTLQYVDCASDMVALRCMQIWCKPPLCEQVIHKSICSKPKMTMLSSSVNNKAQQLDFVLGSAGNTGNDFNSDKQT